MTIELHIISGLMFGVEYVYEPEAEENHIVVDFAFVRILFSWC
jgi:hypothetical protein